MTQKKWGTVLFLPDPHARRERIHVLQRALNAIRGMADLQILSPTTSENQLLKLLDTKTPNLILVPWYLYLEWNRLEAHYGLNRTSGPMIAGYYCDPTQQHKKIAGLTLPPEYQRAIMLDFSSVPTREIQYLIRAMMQEERRGGMRPLLDRNTPIYCENWLSGAPLGPKLESLLSLRELGSREWARHRGSIRICLDALWSLVYEHGPGKADRRDLGHLKPVERAYFQVACDSYALYMRLCYTDQHSQQELIRDFWPGHARPRSPGGLLARFADFIRVHSIAGTQDLEILVAIRSWRDEEEGSDLLRRPSIWIDSLAAHLVHESAYEVPGPSRPQLKNFSSATIPPSDDTATAPAPDSSKPEPEIRPDLRLAIENKIQQLRDALSDRDRLIRELKAGGVGANPTLPPPDMEAIIEAMRERLFEADQQIQSFSNEIAELETTAQSEVQVQERIGLLRFKINALARREEGWIRQLAEIAKDHLRPTENRLRQAKKG